MTKENAAQYLPLVQALAEGKVIEFKDHDGDWGEIEDVSFDDRIDRYRIKPEPREWWLVLYTTSGVSVFNSLEEAKRYINVGSTIHHVMEVM